MDALDGWTLGRERKFECAIVCYTSRQRSMTELGDEKVTGVKLVVKCRHVPINALVEMEIEKKRKTLMKQEEKNGVLIYHMHYQDGVIHGIS
ncbi:unnamed protein product [Sphenostylis stenocarpa]|uniref:Uncharacterized protein n=1 Tax=Sphenostylis stenocarpa TaxID=92480 RepID=A0AA86S5D4_9FABA|nr:unnamed protein product [Sphenostylis stenocarpa]